MTDSMKFGPEWLRNLSAEGNSTSNSGGGTRYHLAEHRYGREEMLALFEQSLKLRPPASMMSFTTLYSDPAMNPLALAPMTEDENRLWTGRGAVQGAPRGRGGSMDRGRGRGRGGTFHPGFNRSNSAYEDTSMRSFDRSQAADRGWAERNGDMNDWGVGSSPRKEYGGSRSLSTMNDNWRRHRGDEVDADGWRTTNHSHRTSTNQEKWSSGGVRGTGNWRDGDTRDEHGHLNERQANSRVTWHSTGESNRGIPHRRPWDVEDHLPEWATENPSESGGTFDSTGAFHGSDDEFPTDKGPTSNKSSSSSRETNSVLQKSASQQNITPTKKLTPLSTSQSATNLTKQFEEPIERETPKEKRMREEEKSPPPAMEIRENQNEEVYRNTSEAKDFKNSLSHSELKKIIEKEEKHIDMDISKKNIEINSNGVNKELLHHPQRKNRIDDEFDHMKEVTDDIVAKLILDDEMPKPSPVISSVEQQQQQRPNVGNNNVTPLPYPAGLGGVLGQHNTASPTMQPPPGTVPDKWYYRDPQGEVQGPFTSQEMAEWFRAGYFTVSLLVRRQCDEKYFTLGDLVKQCPGIPFLTCRLPPLKQDSVAMNLGKVPPEMDPNQLQQIHMQRLLQRHAEAVRTLSQTELWGDLSQVQQRELVTQHIMSQPHIPNTNPLMHMINQMQQANKLPSQPPPTIVQKQPPNSINTQHLDPLQQLVQQMGGMQTNIQSLVSQQQQQQQPPPMPPPSTNTAPIDPNLSQSEDPIKSLIRQLAAQPQRDIWDLRVNQAPFGNQQPQQWLGTNSGVPPNIPHSMWDLHSQTTTPVVPPPIATPTSVALSQQQEHQQQLQQQQQHHQQSQQLHQQQHHHPPPPTTSPNQLMPIPIEEKMTKEKEELKKKNELEKEQKQKEKREAAEKEKKKKEQEQLEKAKALKEAEEKRKEEQRKKEAERKAEAERQKKEEERIRKELEKAKREAEEKRARELEEKRKLREQRKAEEEAKKKAEEEQHKKDEEDKLKKEVERREEQARRQAEALRRMQEQQQQQRTKVAPWCQPTGTTNTSANSSLSLAEIQRIEREKRAEQAALLLQQQKAMAAAAKEQEQQQIVIEKSTMQLNWATKKPAAPKKIKSLAEIQAEEQERVTKQAAEARLAQQQKEKETTMTNISVHTSIWSTASQSLTWATNTHTSGFWDDSPSVQKSPAKPAAPITKSNSTSVINTTASHHQQQQQQQQQQNNNKINNKPNKSRAKKEEQTVMKLFDKNNVNNDEFTAWCTKTLATLNSDVDIPTFVGFLRDIESPYEVKDYVRQYLGDTTQALHFANQFVERRSKVKEQQRAALQHKDDLCQPAPAINPSTEFQEVKGKGKKTKKSKMLKVDARCLGFSVTAAEDRLNVGDRDYGDNI